MSGLFGGGAKYETPAVEVPAAPAPSTKQDTGAIVKVGGSAATQTNKKKTSGTPATVKQSTGGLGYALNGGGLSI